MISSHVRHGAGLLIPEDDNLYRNDDEERRPPPQIKAAGTCNRLRVVYLEHFMEVVWRTVI